ncbi:MAG TPA: PAS domain S-box protein, partial [Candidatus Tectomicrobia bacterium]|nr:PAS domain S-box protein [Candidatus Tectomicrobia bacterium]
MTRSPDALAPILEHLHRLLAQLPSAVYVCEAPGGAIRFYNRRAVELWGREPALGDPDERFCGSFRLYRPDGTLLAHADAPMAHALRDGATYREEVVIERPDGARLAVLVDIAPLRDATGRVVGAVNVFQDISDRKGAEESLRVSEARYRAILDDHPDMVTRFREDGTLTFANDAYCRYFGFAREEIVGRRYLPVVHPDDLPHVQAQLATLGPTNRVVRIENRVVRADGAVRWTEWINQALYDRQGRLVEYQSTGRDVTERKQAEADAARLAAIVSSADDAIVGKTLDGIITSWNAAAERTFGYTADEAVGRSIAIILPGDRLDEEAMILGRVRRGEATEHFETERVTKAGVRIPVSLTISPIRDATGRVVGASSVARDISDRRRAEARLRAHVRLLEILYRLADEVGRAPSLDDVCAAAVDALMAAVPVDRASILVFDDAGVMRFRAWRNLSDGYRAAVDGHSPWARDARDPTAIIVEDVAAEPALDALRDVILGEGIRALAFVPLVYGRRLLGKVMLYYDTPQRPSDE